MDRDEIIIIRVSRKEKKAILSRMHDVGMDNLSNYMRLMGMKGCIIHMDFTEVKELSRLMHINSNNINQYAKKANSTGKVYQEDMKNIIRNQEEELQMLKGVYEGLNKI